LVIAERLMYAYGRTKRLPDRLDKLRRRILRRPQEMIVHAAAAQGAVGTMPGHSPRTAKTVAP
jgi:hypothetical protein